MSNTIDPRSAFDMGMMAKIAELHKDASSEPRRHAKNFSPYVNDVSAHTNAPKAYVKEMVKRHGPHHTANVFDVTGYRHGKGIDPKEFAREVDTGWAHKSKADAAKTEGEWMMHMEPHDDHQLDVSSRRGKMTRSWTSPHEASDYARQKKITKGVGVGLGATALAGAGLLAHSMMKKKAFTALDAAKGGAVIGGTIGAVRGARKAKAEGKSVAGGALKGGAGGALIGGVALPSTIAGGVLAHMLLTGK